MKMLNINQWIPLAKALGPGNRAVVWLQGCRKDCYGCISPEMQTEISETLISPHKLAQSILQLQDIEGVTISGGEPFDQHEGLLEFLKYIKESGRLTTMVYSGYTMEEISSWEEVNKCLQYIDILVDGRFVEELPQALWRGSSNQRIFSPSGYYSGDTLEEWLGQQGGELEFHTVEGRLFTVGIPARGFMEEFKRRLREKGVIVE